MDDEMGYPHYRKPPNYPWWSTDLVGGMEHVFFSLYQLTFICFRGVAQPPTRGDPSGLLLLFQFQAEMKRGKILRFNHGLAEHRIPSEYGLKLEPFWTYYIYTCMYVYIYIYIGVIFLTPWSCSWMRFVLRVTQFWFNSKPRFSTRSRNPPVAPMSWLCLGKAPNNGEIRPMSWD